jgi:hypothetical protein
VIVRWAPDNETLAYTAKDPANAQSAQLFVAKKSGGLARQVLSTDKVVTQLEWSPDGKWLSLARQGEDSDLGAADLILVEPSSGMSKTLLANAADLHAWLDPGTIVAVKVDSKHAKNGDVMYGKLVTVKVDTGDTRALADVRVTNSLGLDANPAAKTVAFTALAVGADAADFVPSVISVADWQEKIVDGIYDEDQKALLAANYATDKKSWKLKPKTSKETLDQIYDALSSTGLMNPNQTWCWLVKVPDGKGAAAPEKLAMAPADFLQFSPDGATLLTKTQAGDGFELGAWSMAGKSYKTLVASVTDSVSANNSTVKVMPAWSDSKTALFFKENKVYGSNGLALTLMSVDTGTLKQRNLQPVIEVAVNQLVEDKGGY